MILRRRNSWKWALSLVLLSILSSDTVDSLAVMSVDLGSEWMKIAVVSPGVPMEIALNVESARKTATAVSLRNGERAFGSAALGECVRYPKTCYFYILDLIGKPFDHPAVKLFRERFPYYDMESDPERGTVLFRHDKDTVYSPEELLGMILNHAKEIAEGYTDQKIRDAVITVPVFFNQAERRGIMTAAELAGLTVLQLISEPMAVALNYGMFRRKEINGTEKNLMFYDMGAYDTTVAIVSYQIVKTKERGFTETHPQAQILGVAYDRTLGGLELQIRLRDYLADKFNELKKASKDVRTVPRAMGKIFKEAGRAKNVLSANNNLHAQIENVMEDIDFKESLDRAAFIDLNAGFFERVARPIDMVLKNAGDMRMSEISEVILVGAGTRVPKVQEILTEKVGSELGKSLNTDESAAMGAVYKAADLSTGFKVKKFITKEAVVFPIDVDFQREYETDSGEKAIKKVKRSLFSKMNSFPQKKIMTFNKFTDDFSFNVNINEVDYLGPEVEWIGGLNLSKVEVKGVKAAMEKNSGENIETKGVKAHFSMDESGLLTCTAVEAVFEKTVTVEEQEAAAAAAEAETSTETSKTDSKESSGEEEGGKEDTWAKLGESISNFFGEKTDSEKKDEKKDKKEAKKDSKKEKKKEKKKEFKPKIESIKENLEFTSQVVYMPKISEESFTKSRDVLRALDEFDAKRKAQETALNALETFVIDTREKFNEEIYEKSSTEEERAKISEKISELANWIDEEAGPSTEIEILQAKLKELQDLTRDVFARVREHLERPEALAALNNMLNSSKNFIAKARNASGPEDNALFTPVELDMLQKKLEEISEWRDKALKEQEEQPMNEMPKMTTRVIAEKGLDLDREVKYLINKAKIAKAEKERERRKKEAEEKAAKEEEERKKKAEARKAKKAKKKSENETETPEEEAEATSAPEENATETTVVPEKEDETSKKTEEGGEAVPEDAKSEDEEEKAENEEETKEEEGETAKPDEDAENHSEL